MIMKLSTFILMSLILVSCKPETNVRPSQKNASTSVTTPTPAPAPAPVPAPVPVPVPVPVPAPVPAPAPIAPAPAGCVISSNPSGAGMLTTESKTLSVTCSQGNNLSYAWSKNNVSLANTTSSLSISNLPVGNHSYSVTVSNSTGFQTVTQSIVVSSTVIAPSGCSIAAFPAGTSMTTIDSKTLTVNCSQGGGLSYTWSKNNVALANSTQQSLNISNQAAGNHTYSVSVSNSSGSLIVSQLLSVSAAIIAPSGCALTTFPSGTTMTVGDSKRLEINCSQGSNFSYAWKRNNASIAGTANNVSPSDLPAGTYNYAVTVSNSSGTQTVSQTIIINQAPPSGCALTAFPTGTTMNVGDSKRLEINCSKGTNFSYAWKRNNASIAGTANNVNPSDLPAGTYNYAVTVSNSSGSQTVNQTIIIKHAPPSECYIAAAPASTSMNSTESKTLTVYCNKGTNLSYLWYKNNASTGISSNIIQLSNLTAGNYTYSVNISNSSGSQSLSKSIDVSTAIITPSECYIAAVPAGTSMTSTESKSLTVNCNKGTNLSYLWYKNNSSTGISSNTIQLSNLTAGAYAYKVVVSNSQGAVTPTAFTVSVTGTGPGENSSQNATSVGAGAYHSCALANGAVKCLGRNEHGQLGDGTRTNRLSPVTVQGLSGVTAIAIGDHHACALANGAVKCWGANWNGGLGDGTKTDRYSPVAVPGLSGVTAIGAGNSHSCAVANGAVTCWGDVYSGVTNPGLSSVTAIAVGTYHSCALANGFVSCWGISGNGGLGDGTTTNHYSPVVVSGLSGVTAIGAGNSYSCALANGAVKCWGNNQSGQLGDGTTTNRLSPVTVQGLSGVTAIAIGDYHACALANGAVKCWGYNGYGQLGDGTKTNRYSPVAVPGLSGVTAITSGYAHSCASANGVVKCLGFNEHGQLGDGTTTNRLSPVAAPGLSL